jgi:hypothetical protein
VKPTDRFSVQELPARDPLREYRRRLLLDGRPTPVVIHGEAIAAQFACGKHFLLVTQYDYFDGVSYWFYLVNDKVRVVDLASTPDYFGRVGNARTIGDVQPLVSAPGEPSRAAFFRLRPVEKSISELTI